MSILKIAIDIDGCIGQYPDVFARMSAALSGIGARIYILTNRDPIGDKAATEEEMVASKIVFNEIVYTGEKADYIIKNGITVVFEDTDEYFLELPESVCVFKVREPGNFNFTTGRLVYDGHTGEKIR